MKYYRCSVLHHSVSRIIFFSDLSEVWNVAARNVERHQ